MDEEIPAALDRKKDLDQMANEPIAIIGDLDLSGIFFGIGQGFDYPFKVRGIPPPLISPQPDRCCSIRPPFQFAKIPDHHLLAQLTGVIKYFARFKKAGRAA